jgi:peptide/nickel transport system substrate-binding protein
MKKIAICIFLCFCLVSFARGRAPVAEAVVESEMAEVFPLPIPDQSDYNLSEYEELTGKKIGKYSESPMLEAMVKDGTLPPVDERLPDEPLVSVPYREIGRYGGTITLPGVARNNWWPAWQIVKEFVFNRDVRWYNNYQPGIAESGALSDDMKSLTINLREGMKWNDGQPLTADDFIFWWEDFMTNTEIRPSLAVQWQPGGVPMTAEKVDDYTVRFNYAVKNPNAIWLFTQVQANGAQNEAFMPRHYLEQFHIRYNSDAGKLAKDEGYEHWYELFGRKSSNSFDNPELPVLNTWVVIEELTDGFALERNPYYHRIDPNGNQLPYFDKARVIFYGDAQSLKLRIIAGDFDFVSFGITASDLPLLISNADKGGYDAFMVDSVYPAENPMYINQNLDDPVKGPLFRNKKFRQALSLAVNRDEVNEIVHLGVAVPAQSTVFRLNSFYEERWAQSYADYDPERANQMLDELGLDKRDGEGFRLLPNGDKLTLFMEMPVEYPGGTETGELVVEYWQAVGVRTDMKSISFTSMVPKLFSGDYEISSWPVDGSEELGWRIPGFWSGSKVTLRTQFTAPLWHQWAETDGAEGLEPPPREKRMFEIMNSTHMMTDEELKAAGKELMDWWAEEFWMVGICGYSQLPFIANRKLGNVDKENMLNAPVLIGCSKLIRAETLFWKE